MDATRIAGVATCLSAGFLLAGHEFEVLPLSNAVLIAFVPFLSILGCLITLRKYWALMPARVVLWALLFISAMMIVPDWDDALRFGDPGLKWRFGFFAGYLLICIVLIGRVRPTAKPEVSR